MHDDQHGTAIISSAALLNALELADKKGRRCKISSFWSGFSCFGFVIYTFYWV
jgi:malate dehydrogenase (oxaloacetate-decarboxylating)(NADP+)